ncbi:hypothetical protein B0H13DRAFT_1852325 [Mycena leptocephala]|nr:hypothetical protein B0H13DRAFT_1852325 [Mycena leptocephala]
MVRCSGLRKLRRCALIPVQATFSDSADLQSDCELSDGWTDWDVRGVEASPVNSQCAVYANRLNEILAQPCTGIELFPIHLFFSSYPALIGFSRTFQTFLTATALLMISSSTAQAINSIRAPPSDYCSLNPLFTARLSRRNESSRTGSMRAKFKIWSVYGLSVLAYEISPPNLGAGASPQAGNAQVRSGVPLRATARGRQEILEAMAIDRWVVRPSRPFPTSILSSNNSAFPSLVLPLISVLAKACASLKINSQVHDRRRGQVTSRSSRRVVPEHM